MWVQGYEAFFFTGWGPQHRDSNENRLGQAAEGRGTSGIPGPALLQSVPVSVITFPPSCQIYTNMSFKNQVVAFLGKRLIFIR